MGETARITTNLVKVDDGFSLWTQNFDRRLDNIFAVQEEIATAVAENLQVELRGVEAVPNRTSNMKAYDSYLRGRAALRRRDNQALPLLEEAIRLDPSFAPAWASLAMVYQIQQDERAIQAARTALELDPENVDALTSLGSTFRQMRRWRDAEEYFRRALTIDPRSAELLEDYSEFLNLVGNQAEALAMTSRGVGIDPRIQPLIAAHAEALSANGRVDDAIQVVNESLDAYGDSAGLWWAALPLWLLSADEQWPPSHLPVYGKSQFAFISSFLEQPDIEQKKLLKSVLGFAPVATFEPPVDRRVARLLLIHVGEIDWVIDRDIADSNFFPSPMREWLWTPFFKDYRAHSRFAEFLSAVGLTDYWAETSWPDACRQLGDGGISCE